MRSFRLIREEQGQATVVIAFAMVGLLGMLGLILDGGVLLVERRAVQDAVDAAAIAAAVDLAQGNSISAATASALYYARQNGYDNNGTTNWVTVSIPPTSGQWSGNSSFAQVTISRTVSSHLIQIVNGGNAIATSSAVGGTSAIPSPLSILVLNRTACGALTVDNNGDIGDADDTHRGAVMVNSSCQSALIVNNNGTITASSVGIVGGYQRGNNGTINPSPQTGLTAVPDPLANLAPPDLGSLTVRNSPPSTAANPSTLQITNNRTVTLYPGVYYGGISASNNVTLNLEPGTYVMAGGGFVTSNNATVNGAGVFVYNTQDPTHPTGAGAYGVISFDNNSNINLSPPSSGTYQGLMFFQDRSNTRPFTVANNGHSTGGTLYFPSAACTLSNNAVAYAMAQVICDTLHVTNNAVVDDEYQSSQVYQARRAVLVQ